MAQRGTVYFCVMEMYFIALVAPSHINEKVLEWKQFMLDHYDCRVALKSPAHITLIAPFWMNEEWQLPLQKHMDQFATGRQELMIQLKDFDFFKPRVIYVNVLPNATLEVLQKELSASLTNNSFSIKADDRPFHPHVTIATRDLQRQNFYKAREHFVVKKYAADWNVTGISLLHLTAKKWEVIHTSLFAI